MAYFMHPDYLPVLKRAYELWRELEAESGERLMTLPGLLCIGEPDGALIKGLESCYAAHDIPHERWTAAEARSRFPQFQLTDDLACYWDPLGGYLHADAAVRVHQQLAQKHGAEMFPNERVVNLQASADSVSIRTTKRTIHAARVVVATGAYSGNLAPGMVTAVRKVLFWYRAARPSEFAGERFPVWFASAGGLEYYGLPSLDGATIKCAEHTGGQIVSNPAEVTRGLITGDEANLRSFMTKMFGSGIGERAAFKTCLYENTKNQDFIVDQHPQRPHIVLAFGGSGHGFKFCSVIGEMAADLAQKGHSALRPEIFRLR
jgi:sarcosine oxidase